MVFIGVAFVIYLAILPYFLSVISEYGNFSPYLVIIIFIGAFLSLFIFNIRFNRYGLDSLDYLIKYHKELERDYQNKLQEEIIEVNTNEKLFGYLILLIPEIVSASSKFTRMKGDKFHIPRWGWKKNRYKSTRKYMKKSLEAFRLTYEEQFHFLTSYLVLMYYILSFRPMNARHKKYNTTPNNEFKGSEAYFKIQREHSKFVRDSSDNSVRKFKRKKLNEIRDLPKYKVINKDTLFKRLELLDSRSWKRIQFFCQIFYFVYGQNFKLNDRNQTLLLNGINLNAWVNHQFRHKPSHTGNYNYARKDGEYVLKYINKEKYLTVTEVYEGLCRFNSFCHFIADQLFVKPIPTIDKKRESFRLDLKKLHRYYRRR